MTPFDKGGTVATEQGGMQDRLDFLFDASGWKVREESPWHLCGEGRIGGREMLAVALCTEATSPLPAKAVADIAEFVRQEQERRLPLILIPSSVELLDEPHLAEAMGSLLGCLSGYRTRAPLLAAALDPLIGPVAMATRLADILCLAPKGSLSLAAESTRHQVPIVSEDLAFKTFLDCSFASDAAALLDLRRMLSILPAGDGWKPKRRGFDRTEQPELDRLIGADLDAPIDARRMLHLLSDDRTFLELGHRNGLIAALVRIGADTLGVLASDAAATSGALDAGALAKAERMVRFCDRYELPIITFVDSPGVLPDDASLAALADLVSAWNDCSVPVISLIVRRAIGAAVTALVPSPRQRQRTVLHWPGAQFGLRRQTSGKPDGRGIEVRETRIALIDALGSIRRSST